MNNRGIQYKVILFGKTLYFRMANKNWGITIMPDNITIDNYHNQDPHIHPYIERRYIKFKTKIKDPVILFEIVRDHLNKNKGLKTEKLIKELTK